MIVRIISHGLFWKITYNSQICPVDPVLNLSRDKEFLVFEILFLSPIATGFYYVAGVALVAKRIPLVE